MDFLSAVFILTVLLISSIIFDFSVLIPLTAGLVCFMLVALYRGYGFGHVLNMCREGAKKSLLVVEIFILIGMLTALWRASGTIPFFVYYGTKIIIPEYFMVFAFILTCMVSVTIGTSLGTVGTIGIVLIVLAKAGGANVSMTAGAILSGAYFGDRCAPTSSSANLVATITGTDLYVNIKNMFLTGALPFFITVILYAILSYSFPVEKLHNIFLSDIEDNFSLNPVVVIPVAIIIIMTATRCKIKISMACSIISAAVIAGFFEGMGWGSILITMISGYKMEGTGQFAVIISGGGVLSMVRVSMIVVIASAYSGIFEATGMLSGIQDFLGKVSMRLKLFPTMILTSILTGCLACNQSFAAILNNQLMGKNYEKQGASKEKLAVDIENTIIVMAALIPWNIALAAPLIMLDTEKGCALFAFYLYLTPLINIFTHFKKI